MYQTAYFASVQQAGLTVATVVTPGAGPVLAAAGARPMPGERTAAAATAALASAVVGLVLLTAGADGSTAPPLWWAWDTRFSPPPTPRA